VTVSGQAGRPAVDTALLSTKPKISKSVNPTVEWNFIVLFIETLCFVLKLKSLNRASFNSPPVSTHFQI
jgi:hypothetical protein